MSTSSAAKVMKVGDLSVTVREITLGEARSWVKAMAATEAETIDLLFFEDFSIPDLRLMTDLTAESIDSMSASQLREVYAAAKDLNADFFGFRARLLALAKSVAPVPLQK